MLGAMDAAQAIDDLKEISPQVRDVVVIGADGAKRLVEAAESMRPGVAQLEAATLGGSVFVVRDGDRVIAATTSPEPTVGLVFYDLKTCLRSIDESQPRANEPAAKEPAAKEAAAKPARRRPPAQKKADDAAS